MNTDIIAFIPARYGSTRLPGKPLLKINDKTILFTVFENICQSRFIRRLIVLTDSEIIAEHCQDYGMEYLLTPTEIPSGTDRICYALNQIDEKPDIVVNIQGDEPMIDALTIDELIEKFIISGAELGTLVKKINNQEELFKNSVVKVTLSNEGDALYFSRNAIPFLRDIPQDQWLKHSTFWKHIGVYIYSRKAIEAFPNLPKSDLEELEKLEQLRFLQNGFNIHCVETQKTFYGVDTQEDYEKVKMILENKI